MNGLIFGVMFDTTSSWLRWLVALAIRTWNTWRYLMRGQTVSNNNQIRKHAHEGSYRVPPQPRRLLVLIHGLNGTPLEMLPFIDKLGRTHDVYCPAVLRRGNCSLDEAVDALYPPIQAYLTEHPEAPVSLIGNSNGGRIAARLECRLRGMCKQLTLVTICTPFYGTYWMSFGICRFFARTLLGYRFDVIAELMPREFIEDRINSWFLPLSDTTQYKFYAARHDWKVFPLQTALPCGIDDERARVLEFDSHLSAPYEVARRIKAPRY